MSENERAASEQLSPANPETETESPNSGGGLTRAVAGGEERTVITNQSLAVASNGDPIVNSGVAGRFGGLGSNVMEKRKRGRPRKYDHHGMSEAVPVFAGVSASASEPSTKRGRGRPKGSGRLQLLGSSGGIISSTAGRSFIPYVETVHTGEDVVGKISSFSQKGPRAVCVLSATGTVSSVIIHQPGSSGGTLRFEGRFEILSLSGSYAFGETASARRKLGTLSVSLAKPDGRVFGGAVAGSLIAAGPIQLVVGSFKQNSKKETQQKRYAESSIAAVPGNLDMVRTPDPALRTKDRENCATPTSELSEPNNGGAGNIITSNQNMNYPSLDGVCWNKSQPLHPMQDQRTSHETDSSVPQI